MHATNRRRPHCKDKSHGEGFERREEQPLPDAVNLNAAASTDLRGSGGGEGDWETWEMEQRLESW
jgi:hypothetical protein